MSQNGSTGVDNIATELFDKLLVEDDINGYQLKKQFRLPLDPGQASTHSIVNNLTSVPDIAIAEANHWRGELLTGGIVSGVALATGTLATGGALALGAGTIALWKAGKYFGIV